MGRDGWIGRRGASRAVFAAGLSAALAMLCALLFAGSALALTQRGYSPAFTVGAEGAGSLSRPAGVAM